MISCPLKARLNQYKTESAKHIAIRKLVPRAGGSPLDLSKNLHLQTFFDYTLGKPYNLLNVVKPVKSRERNQISAKGTLERYEDAQGFFCSELVAAALQCCDIVDQNLAKEPSLYWPRSFSFGQEFEKSLHPTVTLSPEVSLNFGGNKASP